MKGPNQKLKILYILKMLWEKSDENHTITLPQIIDELLSYSISAERKSIYDDLEALRTFGFDIERTAGRSCGYYLASRNFELAELKLMVDAVQSSKFITVRKSRELIKKVESLASMFDAQLLQRQVYVTNRIKTMNESIYYNIDAIHNAIAQGNKISFRYFEWNLDFSAKERIKKHYRHNKQQYEVSPWALTRDNENYYLVGYDSEAEKIKHYRLDKMERIAILEAKRNGKEYFESFDMSSYTQKTFGMFSGKEQKVKLCFHKQLIGVITDRFGKDIFLSEKDKDYFLVTVKVVVSPQFFGWLSSFGNSAKIESPQEVIDLFCHHLRGMKAQYE